MTDAEAIANEVYSWLNTAGYSKCEYEGGDGSDIQGWRISLEVKDDRLQKHYSFYDAFVVQPVYIYYSK